jgi:hypothetical protein
MHKRWSSPPCVHLVYNVSRCLTPDQELNRCARGCSKDKRTIGGVNASLWIRTGVWLDTWQGAITQYAPMLLDEIKGNWSASKPTTARVSTRNGSYTWKTNAGCPPKTFARSRGSVWCGICTSCSTEHASVVTSLAASRFSAPCDTASPVP